VSREFASELASNGGLSQGGVAGYAFSEKRLKGIFDEPFNSQK